MSYKEKPGDARGSALAYQQQMVRLAQQYVRFEQIADGLFEEEIQVTGLSIRVPTEGGSDYLVTIRANAASGPVVGFNAASSFVEALRGMIARLENRSLKWKEDSYASNK